MKENLLQGHMQYKKMNTQFSSVYDYASALHYDAFVRTQRCMRLCNNKHTYSISVIIQLRINIYKKNI